METSDLEVGEPEYSEELFQDDCRSLSSVEEHIHTYQLSDKKALADPYNAGDQTPPLSSQQEQRSHKHTTTEPVYCSTQSTSGGSSSSHQDQGETNGTSGYNTGSRVSQSEPTETTSNCPPAPDQGVVADWEGDELKQPINREPSKQTTSREQSKPSISKEPSKPSISKEPSKPSISKEPSKPSVSKEPSKPSISKEPSKPSISKEPSKPSISKEPSKPSISKELSKPSISREQSKPSISREPSTQRIRRDLASNIAEPSEQSTKTVPSRGPSGVSESRQSDIVPCEQESTSSERGDGMLVSGFSLVLPRNTLVSFCSHQSETFRDRLKPRASDTASPRAVTTHQDRPPPQQAGPPQHALVVKKKPVDDSRKPGRIVRSTDPSVFPVNLVLPVPSKEALQDSIGKGGNGTVTYIYHKRREFAVKKTHFRLGEIDILCKMNHNNIVKLFAVMMGEEDPLRPHRYYCYHFYPRMSGDVQTYLNRLGQGALSNVLMKHKDSPSMLQLIVDNVKHILRCVLEGIHYLHRNDIVHNDIKPSNVLVNLPTQCSCASPVECSCQQMFDVVLTDFDSAIDVRDPEKSKKKWSVVGTAGYRTPERYLQSPEFDDTKPQEWKKGDIWSFGALVLKVFLNHCGPSSQRQIAFLYLWRYANFPWNAESKMANKTLQQKLVQTVYPNWPQLWQLAGDCMQISPLKRPDVAELTNHPFFSS